MAEAGRRRVYLWTIADNVRTRKFYEREGGEVIAEMDRPTFAGIVKAEVAYGWSDVASTSTEGSAVLAPESDEFDVRYADFGDAADIAHIQVATWRDAYRDIMPPEQLDEMNDVRIAAFWAKVLAEADPRNFLLLAERGGHAIGFASCGPCQNPGLPNQGEIFAFYVLPAHQRRGVGRRLIREGFARLAELGMAAARIWTLRDNAPGRAFYERLGGALGGEGRTDIGGQFYTEVAYDWPDLRSWLAHA
jgi:ribosomal protein S18 acetylase RimI-like enzyme